LAHNTSGLPPLDIEPFDPSPLYAAARSPERQVALSRWRLRPGRVTSLVLAVVAVVAVVAAALVLR
jgi:hypothetical protein